MLENERGEPFMGIGLLRLLQAVEKEQSLAQAARAMGISYVKALRIIARLEQNLNQTIVRRRRGGAERGGAELTDAGRRLVAGFQQMFDTVESAANQAFRAFRRKLRPDGDAP